SVLPAITGKLAVAVLVLGLGFSATARAQTTPAASGGGCTFVDQTTSVEPSALKAVLEQHKQVVSAIAQTEALKSWCFVPFTANAWSAQPAATIILPRASDASCAATQRGEADSLFRGAREEHEKKAREACAAARTR